MFRALRLAHPERVWLAPPTYTKTTSDELRDVLTNFDELVAHANASKGASTPCLLEMLLEERPTVYDWCPNPFADDPEWRRADHKITNAELGIHPADYPIATPVALGSAPYTASVLLAIFLIAGRFARNAVVRAVVLPSEEP